MRILICGLVLAISVVIAAVVGVRPAYADPAGPPSILTPFAGSLSGYESSTLAMAWGGEDDDVCPPTDQTYPLMTISILLGSQPAPQGIIREPILPVAKSFEGFLSGVGAEVLPRQHSGNEISFCFSGRSTGLFYPARAVRKPRWERWRGRMRYFAATSQNPAMVKIIIESIFYRPAFDNKSPNIDWFEDMLTPHSASAALGAMCDRFSSVINGTCGGAAS